MQPLVNFTDVQLFNSSINEEKANKMIAVVTAEALRVAPCLKTTADPDIREQAAGIILRAVLRWEDSGSGALQQWSNTDGPFNRSATVDTRVAGSHGVFYPTEKSDLKALCSGVGTRKVKTAWLL